VKGRPARDVTAASAGADPTPAVDPERFQGDIDPYPGHWLESPAPWPFVDPADPAVLAVVEAGLAELPDTWARAVRGHDVERRPETEVAAQLGVTVAQLRDLLNRARAELREHLTSALRDGKDPR
jgi:RNA polymerase sigma-70 factor (ECF subfamily)